MPRTLVPFSLALALAAFGCDDAGSKAETKAKAEKKDEAKAKAKDEKKGEAKADEKKAGADETKVAAKADAPTHDINLDEQGRGLRGFDPLAYHTDGQALLGRAEHTFEWKGAKWQFSSEENMKKFSAEPERYSPANGGWCTFGVVLGKKFDGDPSVWLIDDDSLYVFLNEEVKAKFLEDQAGNMTKVKTNWPTIENQSPAALEG
ncbi:MAG: YHS domain-containing (seleno)protein [Myxococcota bacterium]